MRYKSLFLLSFILYFPFASAQKPSEAGTQASIYLMYAHPIGDFRTAGCATEGTGLGFQYGKEVYHSVSWISDLAFTINWTKKDDFMSNDSKIFNPSMKVISWLVGKDNVNASQYVNIWAMTGAKYEFALSDNPLSIGAQIGILGSKMPELTAQSPDREYKQTAVLTTALAYNFQIDYKINKIVLGLRYWGATPTYKITATDGPGRSISDAKIGVSTITFNFGFII
jgi:hypothetical protein